MSIKTTGALLALLALAACETPPPEQSAAEAAPAKTKGIMVTGSRLGSKSGSAQPDVQVLDGASVRDGAAGHPGSPYGPQ